MRHLHLLGIFIVVATAIGSKTTNAGTELPFTVLVRELQTPAEIGTGESNLTLGRNGQLYITWIQKRPDTSHALFVSRFDSAGWVPAIPISAGRNWFVNWADFPSLAVGENGAMLASWLEKNGMDTYAYGVRLSHSTDAGRVWKSTFSPHNDKTETEHGFVSLVAMPDGEFGAVWLDGRLTVKPDGPMTLRFARIGADGDLQGEALIDPRVCDCCQTAMVRCGDGSLVAAYRDRSDTEVRDISVVRYVDNRWSEPRPLHEDGWRIVGCPVNGPALAAYDRTVAAAWFTMGTTDSATVNVAFSTDCGAQFSAPLRVDLGKPLGRVDICLVDDSHACVIWLQPEGDQTSLMMRIVSDAGKMTRPFSIATTSANRDSGFPHVAYDGERLLMTWTDPEAGPRVRAAQVVLE